MVKVPLLWIDSEYDSAAATLDIIIVADSKIKNFIRQAENIFVSVGQQGILVKLFLSLSVLWV